MLKFLTRLLTGAVAAFMLAACAGPDRAPDDAGPLSIAKQGSFFVGGRDVKSDNLSLYAIFPRSGTIAIEQMYVRYQVPAQQSGPPVVFVHGCCLTGKTWETTPDGRMGWDELFLRRGHPVYVVDQVSRGRSAADPSAIVAVKAGDKAADTLPQVFSAAREGAWAVFRFGAKYPEVFEGMQYPLDAQAEFWKQMLPDWSASLVVPNPTVPALAQLAQRLDGAVLITHSQSGIYPMQAAALDRKGIAGIVSIEPGSCPAASSDMRPYAGLPILVLWGDFIARSPFWQPRFKQCRDFVEAANRAGAKAEVVQLADVGIPGASHMLMQDRNSLQSGDWLVKWIARNVGK